MSAMFARRARGLASSFSRISSSSNLLRNAAKAGKSGASKARKVSSLSTTIQSKHFKANSSNNSSFLSIQEKYGKTIGTNCGSISTACDIPPQILVQLITEAGIGTDLQEDDDEMSSVSGKEKHRRKQKY